MHTFSDLIWLAPVSFIRKMETTVFNYEEAYEFQFFIASPPHPQEQWRRIMARQMFVQKEFAKNVQLFQICSARVHVFVQTISQIIVPGGAGARKNDVMRKLLIVKHR